MQTVMCFLGFVFCTVAAVVCGIGVWFFDNQQKRAKGRENLNDLLTNFGGGSFKNEVKAEASQLGHGCAKTFLQLALLMLIILAIAFFRVTFDV